jgi:hypothetical protein
LFLLKNKDAEMLYSWNGLPSDNINIYVIGNARAITW